MTASQTLSIATRGSPLALAQANHVLAQCRANFPGRRFELKIVKTTGDRLQTAGTADPEQALPMGLFTKELEMELLNGAALFAVHSLKDLPIALPEKLCLAGVSAREDVRDVLIYRANTLPPHSRFKEFPAGATIATSSPRRAAQIQAARPGLKIVPIRGNVGTRLQKLLGQPELAGIVLALAGLKRLGYRIGPEGQLAEGLRAAILTLDEMLPCVGQAALGFEALADNPLAAEVCRSLTDIPTLQAVTAERAFLQAMGGGCLSPVAAYGETSGDLLRLRAFALRRETARRAEKTGPRDNAAGVGQDVAGMLI